MAWADLTEAGPSITLLVRSLERNRLGHAYLFAGDSPPLLERAAMELACTVNCLNPPAAGHAGIPLEACGLCSSCRRITRGLHPDVQWLRAESKLRVIRVEQVRDLIHDIQLKPLEGRFKVGVLVGADRLNPQAGNAFLKTLEEPPPRSLLILLSTDAERLLETIRSRCLRLSFPGGTAVDERQIAWLRSFVAALGRDSTGILQRYQLLDRLMGELSALRTGAETGVEERSPARQFEDADPGTREQWEAEAKAAIEAEYRNQRSRTLRALQWWLRDVWLAASNHPPDLFALPDLVPETRAMAARLTSHRALANLQLIEETHALLQTNVQEALALEVALLRLEL